MVSDGLPSHLTNHGTAEMLVVSGRLLSSVAHYMLRLTYPFVLVDICMSRRCVYVMYGGGIHSRSDQGISVKSPAAAASSFCMQSPATASCPAVRSCMHCTAVLSRELYITTTQSDPGVRHATLSIRELFRPGSSRRRLWHREYLWLVRMCSVSVRQTIRNVGGLFWRQKVLALGLPGVWKKFLVQRQGLDDFALLFSFVAMVSPLG